MSCHAMSSDDTFPFPFPARLSSIFFSFLFFSIDWSKSKSRDIEMPDVLQPKCRTQHVVGGARIKYESILPSQDLDLPRVSVNGLAQALCCH